MSNGIAQETLKIIADGHYRAAAGAVEVRPAVEAAVSGTVLYEPHQLAAFDAAGAGGSAAPCSARLDVTGETTGAAAQRLVREGATRVLALNFASAKNPGGGFLGGARAQEEDLARCSALYTCQLGQRRYYSANRASRTLLYTDHLIYSPDVPFFRGENLELLDEPFLVSIVTSPAPNAGEVARNERSSVARIGEVLRVRAGHVLAVAKLHGHRNLVLGAWGCGVFRNDPVLVADVFHRHLHETRFAGAFDRVVFAVFDRSKDRANFRAFETRFA